MNEVFKYQEEIRERFPTLVGGVISATELTCTVIPPELADLYLSEQTAALDRYDDKPLSEIASLTAWRRTFRAFGVNPTKYRSASEALLRRLTKKGDIPSINLLVDIANLVSIRYALPVAMFDTRQLKMPVTVGFARGVSNSSPWAKKSRNNRLLVKLSLLTKAQAWLLDAGVGGRVQTAPQRAIPFQR